MFEFLECIPDGKHFNAQIYICGYSNSWIIKLFHYNSLYLKGKFSSGREGALASKFNYDFK